MYILGTEYSARAIITRGLYIFHPIFEEHFFVFKEVFHKIPSLSMVSIQERVMMARLLYMKCENTRVG